MILVTAALAGESLDAAYQKEYAYLLAERRELEERLAEQAADSESRIRAADGALTELQSRLVTTTRAADRAEDSFDALEREAGTATDAETLFQNTLHQAEDTLGLDLPEEPAPAVTQLFEGAAGRLTSAGSVGWRDGAFFLPGGESVQGRIYAFGRVAAWGVAAEGQGALAPAGEDRLQLRQQFGRDTAAALAAGTEPARLEIQLFDAERGAEEAEKKGGLREVLKDAGTMGQILFGLGVLSALLVLIRLGTLLLARRGGQALADAVIAEVREGQFESALKRIDASSGPVARVLRAILGASDRPESELDRVVDEAILRETPRIDRFASALVVITAGAPLLGLLGTVTGMIATFDVITEHGTGNPKLMSAGIAEALVCTALGLAVAIPTLLAGNVLASIADGVKNRIDRASLAMLNALARAESERVYPREVHAD